MTGGKLLSRWAQGERSASRLWHEIRSQGFQGSQRTLYRFVSTLSHETVPLPPPRVVDRIAVQQALWLLVRPSEDLKAEEWKDLQELCQESAELAALHHLAQAFGHIVRKREGDRLADWIQQVKASSFRAVKRFVAGLQRDKEEVFAGLTEIYSIGANLSRGRREKGRRKQLTSGSWYLQRNAKSEKMPKENRMLDRSHDTIPPAVFPAESLSDSGWETEVLPRLPEGWQAQARTLKAFQRARQLRQPADLLRGLLAYVLCVRSFRHLGCWSLLMELADVSEANWRKRLGQARNWLGWMLSQQLHAGIASVPWLVRKGLRRVLLVDGTHFKCVGKNGQTWRIHTAFDLLAGRLSEAKLSDQQVGESWKLLEVQAGDLLVSDAINGYPERIAWVKEQQADAVVRVSAHTSPLFTPAGNLFHLIAWLKGRHAPAGRICSVEVCLQLPEARRLPVRLVALRLSEQQRQAAQKRKFKKASQRGKGGKPRADTLYLAGWLIVVTTLAASHWGDQEVLSLYQARWHIELFFKRVKQLLAVHRPRCVQPEHVQAEILAYLLAWALQEEELAAMRQILQQTVEISTALPHAGQLPAPALGQNEVLSEWMVATLSVDLLRRQVAGHFTVARLRHCFPRFQRFVRGSPRRRTHWYAQTWSWLTSSETSGTLPSEVS